MTQPVTILVVDDHPLFRQGLVVALRTQIDFDVVAEAGDRAEAIDLIGRETIDLAVIDVVMPKASGISLAADLYDLQPACRVLGLSVIDEPGLIANLLREHACGYALKTQPIVEIIAAIRHVLGGSRYLPPTISADAVDAELATGGMDSSKRLTRREREVFELLIRGHTNDEIAIRMRITRRTVETHRQRVKGKLSPHSIARMQHVVARNGGLG